MATSPFQPSASLLVKLGSLVVHYEEMTSPKGRPDFDKPAIDTLRNDPEVVAWFAEMTKMAMLPVKR